MTTNEQNTVILIFSGLVLFGVVFNHFVGRVEADDPDHGYTAIWVVIGVLVTVGATVPLIGWLNALFVLGAFAASGSVMAGGSIQRHLAARRKDHQAAASDLQEATRGD